MATYQMVWDTTNKKWTYILDGAGAVDLSQNVILEDGTPTLPALRFGSDLDCGLQRVAANDAAFHAQFLRLRDGDDTNNEDLALQKNPSSDAYILTRAGGTGTVRNLQLGTQGSAYVGLRTNSTLRWTVDSSGHLTPYATDSYDLGGSSLAVRNIYIDDTNDNADGQIDGLIETHGCAWHDKNGITNETHYCVFWRAPYDCVVLKMEAYKLGGTSATINVYSDITSSGAQYLRSTNYAITTDNQWVDVGTLQYTTQDASTSGGKRFLGILSATAGTVTDVSIQLTIKRKQG